MSNRDGGKQYIQEFNSTYRNLYIGERESREKLGVGEKRKRNNNLKTAAKLAVSKNGQQKIK